MAKKKNYVSIGHGLTAVFASGFKFGITGMSVSGVEQALIETTDMDSPEPDDGQLGGKEYIVDVLQETPEVSLNGHFDPSNPPKRTVEEDGEDVVISYRRRAGETTPAQMAGKAFILGWSAEVPRGDKMTTTLRVKFTGLANVVKAATA